MRQSLRALILAHTHDGYAELPTFDIHPFPSDVMFVMVLKH